ncbi:hypothetical protein DPMN_128150 [Dreissena polymorpha]|uniref:Uncharacterized protein n=1 Tax=Dreissena polymorpha TaxID=45954 RepID=A0A9D4GZ01_DREPO|nr:hypothetical protein DPMN_128150 [Dreissena polymorpha]
MFALLIELIKDGVLTWFYYGHVIKNTPPNGGHVFHSTGTIFELFHEDRTINLVSIVLKRKNAPPPGGHFFKQPNHFRTHLTINVASKVSTRLNAPRPGGHVFQTTEIIFKLVQDIIETNLLTKFQEDQT